MASSSRRAVITGLGVLSPIGLGAEAFWHGLQSGRSGIRKISAFDPSALPTQIAGEIPDFDAKKYLDKEARKSLKVMARTIQLAVCAAQLALDDSGVDKQKLDPTRFGVEFGAGMLASELEELAPACALSSNGQPGSVDLEKWGAQGLEQIQPLWMLRYLPNMLACHVSILHNAQGPNNTITESEVAGLLALGEAFRILERDDADFFLVGGADSRLGPLSMVRQCLFQPMSRRNDAPEKACRPFDRDRDGIVIGEGAGVLAVEELEHAKRRGARIYAEMLGFGAAFDPKRDGSGLARAVRTALRQAGVGPEEIDHVSAHGLGTPQCDLWEARGLAAVFAECKPPVPVLGLKGYLGTLGAGSGITELIGSILALRHGQVPPTLNCDAPDPACPITVISGKPQPARKPHVLKVSFTELGQCAVVVCRKWEN
jgi:3-oxoacyl-[acyl-carrier-protein] synthase II